MKNDNQSLHPAATVNGAASAVKSIQSEFSELIAIFDHQLSRLSDQGPERVHLLGAKAAATRGLELSKQLEASLRSIS